MTASANWALPASTAVQNNKLPLLLFVHGCLRFLKSWRRASAWSRKLTAAWQFMQCHNSVCTENTVRPTKIQKCILRAADPTPIQYINLIIYFNNLHRGGATISSCAAAWGATALCTGRSSPSPALQKTPAPVNEEQQWQLEFGRQLMLAMINSPMLSSSSRAVVGA
jgi:hypothetical protein